MGEEVDGSDGDVRVVSVEGRGDAKLELWQENNDRGRCLGNFRNLFRGLCAVRSAATVAGIFAENGTHDSFLEAVMDGLGL